MSKVNNNSMKSITLSFEKYGCLLDLPVGEAGEIIQTVLSYGMTGVMPEIKDRYKAMYYHTFIDPITLQIIAADKRAQQCREAAEARSATIKEAKKIVAKQAREEKSAKKNDTVGGVDDAIGVVETSKETKVVKDSEADGKSVDDAKVVGIASTDSNSSSVTSEKAVNVTSSNVTVGDVGNVTPSEDLSYERLISLGIKRDAGSFNGEMTWNALSDDDKRAAIAYASQNIKGNARLSNSQYASQFLRSKVWKNG